MRQTHAVLATILLCLATAGCSRDCKRVKVIRSSSGYDFTIAQVGSGNPEPTDLWGGAAAGYETDFGPISAIINNGRAESRNLVLNAPVANDRLLDRASVSLSIPATLQPGERYVVSAAFSPAPLDDPDAWGFRAPPPAGQAEVAFQRYHAQNAAWPYQYAPSYTATTASGVVNVVKRDKGFVKLTVDITVGDGSGRQYRLAGELYLESQEFKDGCDIGVYDP